MDGPGFARFLGQAPRAGSCRPEHAGDLFLVFCCAQRVPAALAAFDAHVLGPAVAAAVRRSSAAERDEVAQRLRERLLLAGPGEQPKVSGYSGMGSLKAWVATVAARLVLDEARAAPRTEALDSAAEFSAPSGDPELEYLKVHYRQELKGAFQHVLERLERRDRSVLRLYYLEQVTTDAIGKIYGVHRMTVTRWLAAIRSSIAVETRRRLTEKLGLGRADVDSVVLGMKSDLNASIARLLRTGSTPGA